MSGSLESVAEALNSNTTAINNLIAALAKGGAEVTSSATPSTETKTTAAAKKTTAAGKKADKVVPKYTVDEVAAAAVKVKEELGTAAAQALIKEAGKADKLKEMKPENYDAFVAACELALNPGGGAEDGATAAQAEDDL